MKIDGSRRLALCRDEDVGVLYIHHVLHPVREFDLE